MRQQLRVANLQRLRHPVFGFEVFIDELILHGFAVADRYVIGATLVRELGQLFENSQSNIFPIKDVNIPELNAGRIVLTSNVKPVSVGGQVAKAVYGSLNYTIRGK